MESTLNVTLAGAARREAERRLIAAHEDEFVVLLNEERADFGLPPIKRRVKADA